MTARCGFCGQPIPAKREERMLHNSGSCCIEERQAIMDEADIPRERQCVTPIRAQTTNKERVNEDERIATT